MTNPLLNRRSESEPSRYVARTPAEEAELRNEAMRVRNPQRAEEIEWYAGQDGNVYLRDKPAVTMARIRANERSVERERAIWKANQRRI
jgi:hypothetical protein